MDKEEYENDFFRRAAFVRQVCKKCGNAFWSEERRETCSEAPCTPYSFIGRSPMTRRYTVDQFRELYFRYFEARGHKRVARFPVVPRWRDDVFFVQASIYDFQPWVTSGAVEPPANPLVISQPSLRFTDVDEVGVSGRHLTAFEMMAHHAFNGKGKEIYFKDRTVELCHELLTSELGIAGPAVSYKEEVWEGGGDMGPSLSVGLNGLEVATLVFMQYSKIGDMVKPLPLRIVDTGYGLERFTWVSQGTPTIYEAIFGEVFADMPEAIPIHDLAILVDHSRSFILMLSDGVVPSNVREGYLARMLLRRMLRVLSRYPDSLSLTGVMDRIVSHLSRSLPGLDMDARTLHDIVDLEERRFKATIERGRSHVKKLKERLSKEGRTIGVDEMLTLYDSMGLTPDVVAEEVGTQLVVPTDFFALAAKLHEGNAGSDGLKDGSPEEVSPPDPPPDLATTVVLYHKDPYTLNFESRVLWTEGNWIILDRTYFYPTGGGQITDTGHIGPFEVRNVVRKGPWVVHGVTTPVSPSLPHGTVVKCSITGGRRTQLMQHHTATHILNGALRKVLGPHIWQAGAFKGLEEARLDVTHYKGLTEKEVREVEHMANKIVRENREVKSFFLPRTEAEGRFGFTIYQGGAVPGKELRIVDVDGFDVEACGGTHCTHTSEVGFVRILSTERIQDGMVRLHFTSGERAIDVVEEQDGILRDLSKKLASPPEKLPAATDALLQRVRDNERVSHSESVSKLRTMAEQLLSSKETLIPMADEHLVVKAILAVDPNDLKEVARLLTRNPKVLALLASQREGTWSLFFASGSPERFSAIAIMDKARSIWPGKGGGNASAARATGPAGADLTSLLDSALGAAMALAAGKLPS